MSYNDINDNNSDGAEEGEISDNKITLRVGSLRELVLNPEQKKAMDYMIEGKNVFLTGSAGTGKTFLIQHFRIWCNRNGRKIGVTSTTGVSALIIEGMTLHSYLGIGLGTASVDSLVKKIMKIPYLRMRWRKLEVLVIDEVSMLSS